MAHNPLLGSRISLISKKNIRYEGTLYSINEADATVALENVRSYGTEGRELLDTSGASTFVPPQDVVHAYLLFRGQDIKDLHVHEKPSEEASKVDPSPPEGPESSPPEKEQESEPAPEHVSTSAPASSTQTKSVDKKEEIKGDNEKEARPTSEKAEEDASPAKDEVKSTASECATGKETNGDSSLNKSASKKGPGLRRKNENMVGSGASLLNRKARGAKGDQALPEVKGEFDFESNLAEFDKSKITAEDADEENDPNANNEEDSNVYTKDDFFDSISCDALDKAAGIDNRLRGAAERSLNLDTFGAVSLGHSRRGGRGGRGRGGGRGGRGRSRGGGRGRGRGRGGSTYDRSSYGDRNNYGDRSSYGDRSRYEKGNGPQPRQNNRWKESAY